MFNLFGRKPKKPEDIIPEFKRFVVQLKESAGLPYALLCDPMLNFGVSLTIRERGPLALVSALKALSSLVEEKQAALKTGASIIDIRTPELPGDQHSFVVNEFEKFAAQLISQGYSLDAIADAAMNVWGQIVELVDNDNVFLIALLRKECKRRFAELRRERVKHAATGEPCTEESIDILLEAEAEGFELTIESDGTFVLAKGGNHYLRSNADIQRFGRHIKMRREEEEANRTPVERLTEQGHRHLQAQRLESAISSYSAALRIKPDSAELYFHRGVAWSNTFYNRGRNGDDLQKAIDDYSRGIELDQKYGEAYFSRAGLLSEQGQVAEAIEDYNKTIENGHQVSHSYYCRAHLWKSTGQAAKAIADFDEAIRTGDRNNQYISLMARGEVHCNLGNLELAVADLTAAAAYYPNDPSPGLYTHRAAALRQLGRTREAISDLDQAIAALSSLAGAGFVADIYDQRGQCRMQLGELDSARRDFERAAQLKAQNV